MPAQLIAYVANTVKKEPHFISEAESTIKRIFNLVSTKTGHDFFNYKQNTSRLRRAGRRSRQLEGPQSLSCLCLSLDCSDPAGVQGGCGSDNDKEHNDLGEKHSNARIPRPSRLYLVA
jgi:hypothetical protein